MVRLTGSSETHGLGMKIAVRAESIMPVEPLTPT
jgi:hypothetical protein